jgi:hypothetical protein
VRFDIVNLFDQVLRTTHRQRHRRIRATVRRAPRLFCGHFAETLTATFHNRTEAMPNSGFRQMFER